MIKSLIIGIVAAMVVGTLGIIAATGEPVPIIASCLIIGAATVFGVEGIVMVISQYKIVKR